MRDSKGTAPGPDTTVTDDTAKQTANDSTKPDTVGSNTDADQQAPEETKEPAAPSAATNETPAPAEISSHGDQSASSPKPHEDDSGEVVLEDTEDTVIY